MNSGSYFWIGGLLSILGGIGEWIMGNTFSSTVFLTFGMTMDPFALKRYG